MLTTAKPLRFLDLRLFDPALNASTSNTAGTNDLSPEMKTYYSDYLIDNAMPNLIHDQFGQMHDIPKNGGKTIEFRKYSPLPKATTPLTEGVTPDGKPLNVTTITATVAQYGDYILLTDILLLTAIDNNLVEATELLGDQAGSTLDTITREVLNGGTNVMFAPIVDAGTGAETEVTARVNLTKAAKLTPKGVRQVVRFLKLQNAKKIDGSYVAIIHPDTAYDIMSSTEWIEAHKYAAVENLFTGEIGKIAGCRFVETTEAKIFAEGGASEIDVYSTVFIGANAYGVTKVTGGGLKNIVKPLGSAGAADPLDQRATSGWKAIKTAERLVENFMVRYESASTFDAGAN